MFKKISLPNINSGMTFIELVVVMGIFTAIAGTVLFNYRDFSDGVHLQNLAQEIALQGKRAQTLASQGRKPILSSAQLQNPALIPADWVSSYGIAFRPQENPQSFIFYFNSFDPNEEDSNARLLEFWDFTTNYVGCGSQQESECVEEINITDGSYIEFICLNIEPQPTCNTENLSLELHVSFTRPFLESYIVGDDYGTPVSNAFVKISSRDGSQKRYIEFWSTGQISVQ